MQTLQLQRPAACGAAVPLGWAHRGPCAAPKLAAVQRQQLGQRRAAQQQRLRGQRLAVAASAAAEPKFEPQVAVVLGTQWGDEGKGKLVDILAQEYEVVARAQVCGCGACPACC